MSLSNPQQPRQMSQGLIQPQVLLNPSAMTQSWTNQGFGPVQNRPRWQNPTNYQGGMRYPNQSQPRPQMMIPTQVRETTTEDYEQGYPVDLCEMPEVSQYQTFPENEVDQINRPGGGPGNFGSNR